MKRIFYLLPALLFLGLWSACGSKTDPEAAGQVYLRQARTALAAGRTVEAKSLIDSLRVRQPMALNAREEGILLLDSVNLAEAHRELDSLERVIASVELTRIGRDTMDFHHDELQQKVRFFEKKLQVDRQKKVKH